MKFKYILCISILISAPYAMSALADTTAYTAGGSVAPQVNTNTLTKPTAAPSNPTVAPTTPQVSLSDDSISNSIQNKITNDPGFSGADIKVITNGGIVTLDGTVRNQAQANEALNLAKSENGVKDTKSNLTITSSPAAAPAPATTQTKVIITTTPVSK